MPRKVEIPVQNSGADSDVKYYWEEYKLLQDKIDKIGAFRFQGKNWVVALVTAAVFSGYVAKWPWWSYIFCFLLVIVFWLFERLQEHFQDGFSRRVNQIEREIRKSNVPVFSAKATHVRYSKIRDLKRLPPTSPTNAVYLTVLDLRRTWLGRRILDSHNLFYVLLLMLVFGVGFVSFKRENFDILRPADVGAASNEDASVDVQASKRRKP